ncbi:MAG: hypothetical protein ACMUHB_00210, partial [Thermoplasmatota archaeon]
SSGLLETLTLSYTLFSAGMVPAVFLSIWKKKLGLRTIGALASFVIGGSGVILLHFLTKIGSWSGSLLYIPLTLSFISLPLVSWSVPLILKIYAGMNGRTAKGEDSAPRRS